MSKIIQVLETMASDAALVNEESISSFLTTADVTTEQQQAITTKNTERLAETVGDLPEIIAHVQVLPAEDDEQNEEEDDDNRSSNELLLLASSF